MGLKHPGWLMLLISEISLYKKKMTHTFLFSKNCQFKNYISETYSFIYLLIYVLFFPLLTPIF